MAVAGIPSEAAKPGIKKIKHIEEEEQVVVFIVWPSEVCMCRRNMYIMFGRGSVCFLGRFSVCRWLHLCESLYNLIIGQTEIISTPINVSVARLHNYKI